MFWGHWGTTDPQTNIPSAEQPELWKVKPGAGQNIALYALPADRNSAQFLPSWFIQRPFNLVLFCVFFCVFFVVVFFFWGGLQIFL